MSRRPCTITQADVARVLRAAKQVGADAVEVFNKDGERIVVRLQPSTDAETPLAPVREPVL
jgi:hypothetical protein